MKIFMKKIFMKKKEVELLSNEIDILKVDRCHPPVIFVNVHNHHQRAECFTNTILKSFVILQRKDFL